MLLPLSVNADMITPSHNCAKPASPSHFASETDRASYQRRLGAYKRCLSDFVNEQTKEARMHSEAAKLASDELKQLGY
jgi:hypothetical protein